MKILAIAALALRRLFRDRSNIFWVIVAPLLFVFVLGLFFGGGQAPSLGVVAADGQTAERLTAALATDEQIDVVRYDDTDAMRTDVERGLRNAGLTIPAGIDEQLRAGGQAEVHYLTRRNDAFAMDLGIWVESVIVQQAQQLRAAQLATAEGAGAFEDNLQRARTIEVPGVTVATETTGEAVFPEGLSQFAPLAPSMLLLYVFLTSLTGALGLIQARQRGVLRRVYASPTTSSTIVAGEALGRFAIALTQGLIVMIGSAALFGVDWGDPLGAATLLVVFSLVGGGAAMLMGSLLRTEGTALGVSMGLGLGLAAMGGAMVPLEVLGDTARTVAHITPHAWGYEAFAELVRHGGGVTDILPQLGVLAGMAAVLFVLGAWQLRRVLTR